MFHGGHERGLVGLVGSVIRSNPEGLDGFVLPAYGYWLSAVAGGLKFEQKDLIGRPSHFEWTVSDLTVQKQFVFGF